MSPHYLSVLGLLFCLFLGSTPAQELPPAPNQSAPKQPNIVFILADDLGYGDLEISGNPIIKTPNIGRLASRSVNCTNAYAAGPVCMPSRISILTGKYDYRTGARMSVASKFPGLDQPWLPGLLKDAGYATAAIGKWHMGNFPSGMRKIGFQTWAITAEGGWCDYWDYTIKRPNLVKEPSQGRYGTDLLTDEAVKFITEPRKRPFFLYLAYTAPHFPLEAPEEEIKPFQDLGLPAGTAIVYAMITRLDKGIGKVLEAIRQSGQEENTIVVFTSDNGPEFGPWRGLNRARFNAGLAGEKGDVLEGGIKVPALISWPAVFGQHPAPYSGLVDGVDWAPTLAQAAGLAPAPEIDGSSFLEKIRGNAPDFPKRFWSYNKVRPTIFSNGAMRDGKWKLVRPAIPEFNRWDNPADLPLPEKKPAYCLFDIQNDPAEKHDLAAAEPARLAEMIQEYERWFKGATTSFDDLIEETPSGKTQRLSSQEGASDPSHGNEP